MVVEEFCGAAILLYEQKVGLRIGSYVCSMTESECLEHLSEHGRSSLSCSFFKNQSTAEVIIGR